MLVLINNFNLVTWPFAMAMTLAKQGHRVVFVDNGSTYPPLLDMYGLDAFEVLYGPNMGHNAPFGLARHLIEKEEYFVTTDPDLDLSGIPEDWPDVLKEGMLLNRTNKCGFHLDDSRIPSTNPAWTDDRLCEAPDGRHPDGWRDVREIGTRCAYYGYPIDTTFALHRRGTGPGVGGVRSGFPYVARHWPWHIVPQKNELDLRSLQYPLDDELRYYYRHASDVSTTKLRLRAAGIIT